MKKIVAITGASSGIGKAIAQLLLENGFTVYGFARSLDKMDDLRRLGAHTAYMDVTDEASVEDAFNALIRKEGRIDVLINNAGYGQYGALETVPIAEAQAQMDVNLFGLARVCQQALPHMRKQHAGVIINISSIAGKLTSPLGAWYFASKHAVEGLSDSLRQEVGQFGIDVVLIEPGGVKSEWAHIASRHLLETTSEAYASMAKQVVGTFPFVDSKNADPMVIARLVLKAITARRPKTRYIGGKNARLYLLARKLLPDKWFDRIVLAVYR